MRKFMLFFALLGLLGMQSFAQQVTGTVTSAEDGSTLPGVSVVVKGTTNGTVTDIDGNYSLPASQGSTLVFSFVGMKTVEVPVTGSTVNVVLEVEDVGLDEVVVVAYGVQRKEAKTGAVAVVKADDMKDIPATSPEKLLQGKVAGLQLNNNSGQPGSSSTIRIRGFSSINSSNEPLYVIDGVPVASGNYTTYTSTGNVLSSLNPNDIESITVLKDAAAASVYGSRAANGVVLITTKSGRKGKTNFNFRSRFGQSKVANFNDFRTMNASEIYKYMRDGYVNSGYDPTSYVPTGYDDAFFAQESLPASVETYDWMDDAFRTATTQDYEFSVSGGNEMTTFYTSGGYSKNEGIMTKTGLERYSLRSNVDINVNKMLKVGTKIYGAYTEMEDRPNESMYYVNPFWASLNLLPWHLPKNSDGTYNFDIPSNADANFIAAAEYDDQWEKSYKIQGSAYAELRPIEGLVIKSLNSIETYQGQGRRWWDPRSDAPGKETGTLQESMNKLERYTSTNTINYNKMFADVHSINVLLGHEAFYHKYQTFTLSGENLGTKIPYLSGATKELSEVGYDFSEYALLSFFSKFEYNFDSRYYLSASFRRDGNSKFGKDNRFANFWSVGGSWNIHNEGFAKSISLINMLKLRGSYGINGNQGIGTYDQYGTYYTGAYNGFAVVAPENLANPQLTWELNTGWNVGLDFALMKKLQGSIEFYQRVTDDMLLDMPLSRTTGFSSIRQNIGSLKNTGIEATISYIILDGEVNWDVNANFMHNKTEITDLGGEEEISDGWWRRYRLNGEGFSEYYVYDWAGVNPTNGMGMWYDEQGNITQNYSNARRVFRGKVEPDFQGGFGTTVSWKGISLNMFFEYKLGNSVYIMEQRYTMSDGYNWGSNQNAALLGYWEKPGDVVANPKPLVANNSNSNAWGTSRFLEKGDYLRFSELTLSYSLPRNIIQRAKIGSARVFGSINNLYAWHDVNYWDPDRPVTGGGYIVFPKATVYSFGLEIGF